MENGTPIGKSAEKSLPDMLPNSLSRKKDANFLTHSLEFSPEGGSADA